MKDLRMIIRQPARCTVCVSEQPIIGLLWGVPDILVAEPGTTVREMNDNRRQLLTCVMIKLACVYKQLKNVNLIQMLQLEQWRQTKKQRIWFFDITKLDAGGWGGETTYIQ